MWKPIDGTEGRYHISNKGRVFHVPNGLKKLYHTSGGYLFTSVIFDGKTKTCLIHRLVALAFIDNPDNKPEVNHINGVKSDNTVQNLQWVTKSENERHAWDYGLKKSRKNLSVGKIVCKPVAQYSLSWNLIRVYDSVNDAVRHGFNYACIIETIRGLKGRTQHKGYRWSFYNGAPGNQIT